MCFAKEARENEKKSNFFIDETIPEEQTVDVDSNTISRDSLERLNKSMRDFLDALDFTKELLRIKLKEIEECGYHRDLLLFFHTVPTELELKQWQWIDQTRLDLLEKLKSISEKYDEVVAEYESRNSWNVSVS